MLNVGGRSALPIHPLGFEGSCDFTGGGSLRSAYPTAENRAGHGTRAGFSAAANRLQLPSALLRNQVWPLEA